MNDIKNICFFGGGSWGQALAITLARTGYPTSILVSDKKRKEILNSNNSNKSKDIMKVLSFLTNRSYHNVHTFQDERWDAFVASCDILRHGLLLLIVAAKD